MPKRSPLSARVVTAERLLARLAEGRGVAVTQAGSERVPSSWVVKPRAIAEHHAYLVASGTLHGRVGGRRLRLDAGGMIWLMPGVLHEFWIDPAARPLQSNLKVEIGGERLRRDAIVLGDASTLQPAFAEVVRESQSREPYAAERLRAALVLLLSGALRLGAGSVDGATLDVRQRERLARFAARHLADRVAPAELAREIGLNADYFARVFRRSYGVSPRAWLVRERLREAARRLRETDAAIERVALDLGYPDVFLFSRQFKRVYGASPTAFRREA